MLPDPGPPDVAIEVEKTADAPRPQPLLAGARADAGTAPTHDGETAVPNDGLARRSRACRPKRNVVVFSARAKAADLPPATGPLRLDVVLAADAAAGAAGECGTRVFGAAQCVASRGGTALRELTGERRVSALLELDAEMGVTKHLVRESRQASPLLGRWPGTIPSARSAAAVPPAFRRERPTFQKRVGTRRHDMQRSTPCATRIGP